MTDHKVFIREENRPQRHWNTRQWARCYKWLTCSLVEGPMWCQPIPSEFCKIRSESVKCVTVRPQRGMTITRNKAALQKSPQTDACKSHVKLSTLPKLFYSTQHHCTHLLALVDRCLEVLLMLALLSLFFGGFASCCCCWWVEDEEEEELVLARESSSDIPSLGNEHSF